MRRYYWKGAAEREEMCLIRSAVCEANDSRVLSAATLSTLLALDRTVTPKPHVDVSVDPSGLDVVHGCVLFLDSLPRLSTRRSTVLNRLSMHKRSSLRAT